jgi:hypothetical protein
MITSTTFTYKHNFPNHSPAQIQGACDVVDATWSGVSSLWKRSQQDIRDKKITAIQNLLVAWYLTDVYPMEVTGVVSNGGLPLKAKTIAGTGGTSLDFRELGEQSALIPLSSNTFGVQVIQMFSSCPERFTIYG